MLVQAVDFRRNRKAAVNANPLTLTHEKGRPSDSGGGQVESYGEIRQRLLFHSTTNSLRPV